MLDFTLQTYGDEARMRDLDLARALGFDRVTSIRVLLGRHMATLERFGPMVRRSYQPDQTQDDDENDWEGVGVGLHHSDAKPPAGPRGRPSVEYWLNKRQALFVCTKSDAENAVEVTLHIIDVFVQWTEGTLAPHPAAIDAPRGPMVVAEEQTQRELGTWLNIVKTASAIKGIKTARRIWNNSPLVQFEQMSADAVPYVVSDDVPEVDMFIASCFDVTGQVADSIPSGALVDMYQAWRAQNHLVEMSLTTLQKQIKESSLRYVAPQTGKRFWVKKSNIMRYCGLRPRNIALAG